MKQAQGGSEEMKFGWTLRPNSEFPGSNGGEGHSRQRRWLREGTETLKPIGERRSFGGGECKEEKVVEGKGKLGAQI